MERKVGRRALIAIVTVAVAVAAIVGLTWLFQSDDGDKGPGPATGSSTQDPPVTGLSQVELDATYEACARSLGFDPGGVQVLVEESGRPWWVKTGRDVPAEVHRPCLVRIGGADPGSSSYGPP